METSDLIQALARDVTPVKRLPHPLVRGALWLSISAPYIAVIVLAYDLAGYETSVSFDGRFLVEELATVATAVTAAVAAFCCIVPGRDRRIALVPLLPLALWLASIGAQCASQWLKFGVADVSLNVGWECLPPSILIGVVPAIAMVFMLRRGAPLYPRSTILLGALAVAALGNLGLRLFHAGDVTVMMLVWHLGAVALLCGLASFFGPRMLRWRYRRADAVGIFK